MKKTILAVIILLILLIVGILIVRAKFTGKEEVTEVIPTPTVVLPTISDEVDVSLSSRADKRAVVLRIKKIPSGVESIEYEMTYTTAAGLVRGINGTIKLKEEKEIVRDDLTLGSCSAGGRCTYDEGVTSVDLALKFNSSKGASIFRKTYAL